jgi:hypothetical protein
VAHSAVEAAGFVEVAVGRKPFRGAPLEVDIAATDPRGRRWWFVVAGGFTTGPTGLRRTDVLWRTIGEAAALHAADPCVPIVVLTTGVPGRGHPNEAVLRPLIGDLLCAVVDLADSPAAALEALRSTP